MADGQDETVSQPLTEVGHTTGNQYVKDCRHK